MSDTTTYPPAAHTMPPPAGLQQDPGAPASFMAAPGADKPKALPVVKEPTINERAAGLLAQVTDSHRHNAPITPWMLTELGAVVAHVTGNKAVAPQHLVTDSRGLPDQVVFRKADGGVMLVTSAEEALAYVRSLPKDVQARPHWVAADKALVEATESVIGSDVSPAIRSFEAALAEDRRLDPKPVTIAAKA